MEEAEIGEVGTDKVAEQVHEKAREDILRVPWIRWLALSTAFFAVLAAIASLKSGQFANEALLNMNEATLTQAQASDAWAYYQAKGIKQITREAEADTLRVLKAPDEMIARHQEASERLKAEQANIEKDARTLEQEQKNLQGESRRNLERHHSYAYAVTLLQVAIGLSAIAALVERRGVWLFALLAGAVGIILFVTGLLR